MVNGVRLINVMQGKQIKGYPSAECCQTAELEKAEKGHTVKGAKGCCRIDRKDNLKRDKKFIVVRSRIITEPKVLWDTSLGCLNHSHTLAKMYMRSVLDHGRPSISGSI